MPTPTPPPPFPMSLFVAALEQQLLVHQALAFAGGQFTDHEYAQAGLDPKLVWQLWESAVVLERLAARAGAVVE